MTDTSRTVLFVRGARKRCPRCDATGLFSGWFSLVEACPGCGHRFERDPGYWLGAMIINTAVVIGVFLAGFVGAAWLTWPEVPWTAILIGTMIANVLVPLAFYPYSKTLFVALDLAFRPLTHAEEAEADRRVATDQQHG